ncbi:hypothetical protein [Rhodovulum visakhapatnamense]|uniref:Type IV pilus biogenesis protein PilP n=1 Tax=Rhodovulum visakhapatnamense TaxID=364297 RepID=A0A4R8FC88_9RHOB|nr:hypothetical protein [Rhodovulum visakhapatnamense]TDX23380.1 hypothetical protein EV657_12630 [Rhodovulum visakhapatnamense]
MKPDFALTLSEDGIGLQHRAKGGWRSLGEVSLHDPGLAETLRLLRATAGNLADGRPLVKLVLPDSQVLYTTLALEGDSRAEKRASLLRGLDGLTPYAVTDLIFDWQETAGSARLAVVARETLAEAEAFARAHQFDPVCFVARPPASKFEGEAFFGPTAAAASLLAGGERAEPERAPQKAPKAETAPRRKAPPPVEAEKPARAPQSAIVPTALAAAPARTEAAAAAIGPDLPAAAETAERPPAPKSPNAAPASPPVPAAPVHADVRLPAPDRRPAPGITAPAVAPPAAASPIVTAPAQRPESPAPAFRPPPQRRVAAPGAAAPRPVSGLDLRAAERPSTGPELGQMLKLGGAGLALVATLGLGALFLTRGENAPPSTPELSPVSETLPTGPDGGRAASQAPDGTGPDIGADEDDSFSPDDGLEPVPEGLRDTDAGAAPSPDTAGTADEATAAPAAPPEAPPPTESLVPAPLTAAEALEAYASTGIWQRAPDPLGAPSQDRIEDLFVAGIDPAPRPPEAEDLPDPQIARAVDQALPMQSDPPGPDQTFELDERGLVEATPEGALTPEGVTVHAGAPVVVPPARPDGLVPDPEPVAVPAPGDTAAGAEITTEGVPVYDARPEVTPPGRPADAAPETGPDTAPDTPAPDAAAPGEALSDQASEADRDAAIPQTAETAPEVEIAVSAGSPTPRPPARPGTDAAPAAAPPAEATPSVIPADPAAAARLAGRLPRARPETLLARTEPPAEAEAPGLHPRARPGDLAPVPDAPSLDTDAAVTAALEDLADGEGEAEASADLPENALVASLRPASRPSDFEERAVAAAPAVPAAAAVAPSVPTTASVAKQATLPDAINLRDLNLIGVFGSSADRRALLRLPSGRFVKVKVGDSIDGGQVAAIGETQLRYVKHGRNIVLDLPGG